jgi:hypothetical protein
MIIPVNPIKQKSKVDCVPACGDMILSFFDRSGVVEGLPRSPIGGCSLFDLASHLQSKGLKTFVNFTSFYYFDNSFNDLDNQKKLDYLTELNPQFKMDKLHITGLINCVKSGVGVSHELLTMSSFRPILQKSLPIVTSVKIRTFRQQKFPSGASHAIVINGLSDSMVHYVDPHWTDSKFGQRQIRKDVFFASFAKQDFCIMLWCEK